MKLRAAWRRLGGAKTSIVMSTGLSQLLGFAVGKIVAVRFGPDGVGYQGALQGAAVVAAGVILLGSNNSLPAFVSRESEISQRHLFGALLKITAVPFLVIVPLTCFLLVRILSPPFQVWVVWTGVAAAILAATLGPIWITMMAIFRGPGGVALQQTANAVVVTCFTTAACLILPLEYLPLVLGAGLLLGQISARVATAVWRPPRDANTEGVSGVRTTPAPGVATRLLKSSLGFFVSSSAGQFAYSAIPLAVFVLSTPDTGGLFRAALSVGIAAATLLGYAVTYHFYPLISPRIAAGVDVSGDVSPEVRSTIRVANLGAAAIAIGAPLILLVAYSAEFLEASSALALIAAATVPRILAQLNSAILMASYRRRLLLANEWMATISFLLLPAIGVVLWGVVGAGAGYLAACVVGAVFSEYLTRSAALPGSIQSVLASRSSTVAVGLCLSTCAGLAVFFAVFLGSG